MAVLAAIGVGIDRAWTVPRPEAQGVTVSSQITSSAADVEERASGTMQLSNDELELTVDQSVQTIGLRFENLGIPPGARILEADLGFVIARSTVGASSLDIAIDTSDEPAEFSERLYDLTTRPRSDVRVKWAPGPWLPSELDSVTRSPELRPLVQSAVDQPWWSADDPLVFLISGVGTRIAWSFDGDAAAAPTITVVYEPPDNEPPTVAIAEPRDGVLQVGAGDEIELRAEAIDPEDGDITDRLSWISDLDGQLGSGGTVSTTLSAGPHRLTAVVHDGSGRGSAGSVDVVVRPSDPVVIAAGEIASCLGDGDALTADVVDKMPWATVLALGDQAYPDGTVVQYEDCFDPTWGRFQNRIRAVPGNLDYHTLDAGGYYSYFDTRSGELGTGWYAYDLGSWRIIALNTNCEAIGGCDRASPQLVWLAEELASSPSACTLVYGHQARFGSDLRGGDDGLSDVWTLLDEHNVDVVLAGHDRSYERFAPQTADATADADGIRQFVVGTGGADTIKVGVDVERGGLYTDDQSGSGPSPSPRPRAPNSELFDTTSRGLLQLVLGDGYYTWTFLPIDRAPLRDHGEQTCNSETPKPGAAVDIVVGPVVSNVRTGAATPVTATAVDDTGSDVSNLISWHSDRDGELGSGPQVDLGELTPGRHVVSALLDGTGGFRGASSFDVDVLAADGSPVETATAAPIGSTDDAQENVERRTVSIDDEDLELSDEDHSQLVGIRFPDLAVPAGATIVRAHVQFTASKVRAFSERAELRVRGDANARSQPFNTSQGNLSRRSSTAASVDWSPGWWHDPGDATAEQRTPDLAPIIQEVIDQPRWDTGNALTLLFSGTGSRIASSFDDGRSVRPELVVEFVR